MYLSKNNWKNFIYKYIEIVDSFLAVYFSSNMSYAAKSALKNFYNLR